ncbi:hypothetical protein [Nonomuraea basaltis]|nr:hypothetical protein [Nonomuraea basaltis]
MRAGTRSQGATTAPTAVYYWHEGGVFDGCDNEYERQADTVSPVYYCK